MTSTSDHPRVIVGCDGSGSAEAAITWAATYARDSGADLEIVTAWSWPMTYGYTADFGGYDPRTYAERVVQEAAEKSGLATDRVSTVVVEGSAASVLVEKSHGAAALVVGTRGHGDLSEVVLGSVSNHCTHHAACPVVVVRSSS